MIIVDENVDQLIIGQLDTNLYEILLIRDYSPGISDKEIIELAKTQIERFRSID